MSIEINTEKKSANITISSLYFKNKSLLRINVTHAYISIGIYCMALEIERTTEINKKTSITNYIFISINSIGYINFRVGIFIKNKFKK
jgi:hypothetical protein